MKLKEINKADMPKYIGRYFIIKMPGGDYPYFVTFNGYRIVENEGIASWEDQWRVGDCEEIWLIQI